MAKEEKDLQFIDLSPSKEIVTIPFKRPSKKDLEKVIVPPSEGMIADPKPKRSRKNVAVEKKPKAALKKEKRLENVELIITEKPQAAMKIAYALSESAPSSKRYGKVSYYECKKGDKIIYVGCAVGHLYSLFQKERGFPVFELEWKPSYTKKGSEYTKQYLDTLVQLSKKASKFIIATDYDIEGEVIGLNVMRFASGQKDASRMKFSTLTKPDIVSAYENQMSHIDWGLAYAGETRHYLDWLYGINLSRALMNAIKSAGSFAILSIGRVQGPALQLIVKKEREIMKFKSMPYWQVSLMVKNSHELLVKYPKDILDSKELEFFKKLKGKKGDAKTETKEEKLPPQAPFDLTTLQLEAYKFHGITPAQLLQIAQRLYLEGLISYPRTSSQKLPPAIGYEKILKSLPKGLTKFVSRKTPIEGKKSDPAHPAIYPTGEDSNLKGDDEKVYNLIMKRFISCFCPDASLETKNVSVIVDEKKFTARGMEIKEKGWLNVYPSKLEEKDIPSLNGEVTVQEVITEEKETQPPHRFSAASLVSELAKRNLGTKSTRALIIETLYKRGYVEDKQIKATSLGMKVTETLEKYSPPILDENLTRKFEKEMDAIQTSKKGLQEEEKIINAAKKVLTEIAGHFKQHEKSIGEKLLESLQEKREADREAAKIMPCPKCQKGSLAVKRSRQGRQFIACDAYPECTQTFSLPPYGLIKKTEKACDRCGWPILMSLQKAKRPWFFCFNPECPTRKEREAQKQQEQPSTEAKENSE